MADTAEIEVLGPAELEQARPLLLDLMVEDQGHYQHSRQGRDDIDVGLLGELRPTFQGENVMLVIREGGRLVALCWCVIFDPGTGLEGEVAEVYVVPDRRGRGLATRLIGRAVELFGERRVTFASVWTHAGNPAALRLYQRAGFAPTEQTVLTWLPGAD